MFLLDACSLIHLDNANLLKPVLIALECATTVAVYNEVVRDAGGAHQMSALSIGEALSAMPGTPLAFEGDGATAMGLGAGEWSLLDAAAYMGERNPRPVVITDDRRFTEHAKSRGLSVIDTVAFIAALPATGIISVSEACDGLERLRGAVPDAHISLVRQTLGIDEGNL